ncbi:uncharacterized protein TRIADDRAFT_57124 [Trichoplax adhaerens]|uniref:Uncharacterized protein n=1 Tax=Trichoplax adhaerens TaxID=10228 RepID=B3S0P4_TRIAD|nr:predicted protein [Trichoplax adhaerens]EDV23679.1 predicted protein [Trichoplax adhaerens]|eukprot:XP_002113205.1 predicted protein [Trichoplax adhaerens]
MNATTETEIRELDVNLSIMSNLLLGFASKVYSPLFIWLGENISVTECRNTNPAQILPQIDKCLREAGSVQVRVRRDADDQIVLLQVTERLSRYVSNLTVQIIKDDWQRTVSNPTILRSMNYGDKNMLENYNFSSFSNDTVYYTPTKDRSNMISASTPLIFEQRGH